MIPSSFWDGVMEDPSTRQAVIGFLEAYHSSDVYKSLSTFDQLLFESFKNVMVLWSEYEQ